MKDGRQVTRKQRFHSYLLVTTATALAMDIHKAVPVQESLHFPGIILVSTGKVRGMHGGKTLFERSWI